MNAAAVRAVVSEARTAVHTMRAESSPEAAGPIVVSGMLAEQLARELGAGADPGAVVFSEGPSIAGARVVVRVIAGDPGAEDEALVRDADHAGIPVVLVQLWPQEEWRRPFVLSPFVVECRTGEGFPIAEIAQRIAAAAEHAPTLASRIPVLEEAVSSAVVRGAIARTAALALGGAEARGVRPLIALEQIRMLSRLRALEAPGTRSDELPVVAGTAGATLAASYALRALARRARRALPAPVADAAVAVAGTWALAEVLRRLEKRGVA